MGIEMGIERATFLIDPDRRKGHRPLGLAPGQGQGPRRRGPSGSKGVGHPKKLRYFFIQRIELEESDEQR